MKLLHIDSSALGASSVTRELSAAIVARWQDAVPGLVVEYRDLDRQPVAHLSAQTLARTDPSEVADAENVLAQFQAADVVVIGAPMYNFTIPPRSRRGWTGSRSPARRSAMATMAPKAWPVAPR